MALVNLNMSHFRAHRGVLELLHSYRHRNVMRMRPYLTEPTHAAGHNEHRTQYTYARIRDQACEGERQAQGQYQRPCSGAGSCTTSSETFGCSCRSLIAIASPSFS